jgi:hypothetical protein
MAAYFGIPYRMFDRIYYFHFPIDDGIDHCNSGISSFTSKNSIVVPFLQSHGVRFVLEYQINYNNGIRITCFRYDIYLPDYNLIIEQDGHSHDPYRSSSYSDPQKTQVANSASHRIVRIPEYSGGVADTVELEKVLREQGVLAGNSELHQRMLDQNILISNLYSTENYYKVSNNYFTPEEIKVIQSTPNFHPKMSSQRSLKTTCKYLQQALTE